MLHWPSVIVEKPVKKNHDSLSTIRVGYLKHTVAVDEYVVGLGV